jgi:hypothetical protein
VCIGALNSGVLEHIQTDAAWRLHVEPVTSQQQLTRSALFKRTELSYGPFNLTVTVVSIFGENNISV